MIARAINIYKRTAQKNELSLEIVTSIGKAVFADLADKLMHPEELGYELDHFGTFMFRQKHFLTSIEKALRNAEERPEDYQRMSQEFKDRMAMLRIKIHEFKAKKDEVKKLKHEYKERTKQPNKDNS